MFRWNKPCIISIIYSNI